MFPNDKAETRALLAADLAELAVAAPAEGERRVLTGYAGVFWDPSRPLDTSFELRPGVRERILPGAFDDVLANDRPAPFDTLCLYDHGDQGGGLLGRRSSGTLRLAADERGLRYECDLPGSRFVDELVELIERRDVYASSFKFLGCEQRFVREDGITYRELLGFEWLIDVGPGVRAAYLAASHEVSARTVDAYLAEQAQLAQRRAARLRKLRISRLR